MVIAEINVRLPLGYCLKDIDCEPDECCLKRISLIHGLCRKRPLEGERCHKTLFDRSTITKSCPCALGLECKFKIPVIHEGICQNKNEYDVLE